MACAMYPKISVIIPCRGESDKLPACLVSVKALDYPEFDIFLVDDGMDAFVCNRIRESFGGAVKILESCRRGPSYARNLAAGASDADYVAFTDSDCIVDKNWLRELLAGFMRYPDTAGCGGIQKLPQDASRFERHVFAFMKRAGLITDYVREECFSPPPYPSPPGGGKTVVSPPLAGGAGGGGEMREVSHNPSCSVMYRRDIFMREGGFLWGLWPGEDVEFDYRLKKKKYKLVFNSAAVVYHHKPDNVRTFRRMMYNYGRAQGALVRRYGIFRKVQLVPPASAAVCVWGIIHPAGAVISGAAGIAVFGLYARDMAAGFLAAIAAVFWNAGFVAGISKGRRSPRGIGAVGEV